MMKERPLKIVLKSVGDKLVVVNNLQRKVRQVTSNKVGLGNIAKKYKLLEKEGIIVKENEHEFAVIIPLIAPPPAIHQPTTSYF